MRLDLNPGSLSSDPALDTWDRLCIWESLMCWLTSGQAESPVGRGTPLPLAQPLAGGGPQDVSATFD